MLGPVDSDAAILHLQHHLSIATESAQGNVAFGVGILERVREEIEEHLPHGIRIDADLGEIGIDGHAVLEVGRFRLGAKVLANGVHQRANLLVLEAVLLGPVLHACEVEHGVDEPT